MKENLGPLDEYSGLPLPILPVEAPNSIAANHYLAREYCRHDQHHAFFPKSELQDEGDLVLRHSRLQYGPRWAHSKYHEFYTGVQLPETKDRQFALGVLATAGYIPETAVNVGASEPRIVELYPHERRQMHEETVYPEQRFSDRTGRDLNQLKRGVFFMEYALQQKFDHVREVLLEEFLETTDRDRKQKLGMFIVDMAFARAAEPIDDMYRVAHKQGYIPPERPRHTVGFLRGVVQGYQPDYFTALEQKIETSAA